VQVEPAPTPKHWKQIMKKIILLLTLFILFFFSFSLLLSDTIIVDINGGGDYTTIQEGIDAAINGDTVLVYPGTYFENINYNGKNITFASLYIATQNNSYIDSTIIDGNQNGSVVTFASGEDSTAVLCGFTIQNGSGTSNLGNIRGGGIFSMNADPKISSCIIKNNNAEIGAGIHCRYSNIILENTTICFNHALYHGGGVYLRDDSTINLNSLNRCNIYNNYAGKGCDFCSYEVPAADIIVDTFTVLEPDKYFIQTQPENNFTLNILNGWLEPANQDLYVSSEGDNANSGLNENEPLKTISWALTKIASDSTNPNTIHLSDGIYSHSLTGEIFPLNCRSYVSIIGEDEENTIMYGGNISSVIWSAFGDNNFSIENLTIQNGNAFIGAGIYFYTDSSPILKNITLNNNTCSIGGGAIYCGHNCNPIFENVTITDNYAENIPGIFLTSNCNPVFINSKINGNYTTLGINGIAGICCLVQSNPIFINTEITNNNGGIVSGLSTHSGAGDYCDPILINCTICNNSAASNGAIRQTWNSNLTLINCILRNYSDDEIYFYPSGDPDTVTISYTNIKDSIYGINTNNNGTINWLEGNIDEDPMFVDTLNNNYQLQPGSPCIDAGTPDTTGLNLPYTDLAGNQRIYNGRIDIGAYEYQGIGIDEPDTSFIHNLYLFNNSPNPFKESTTISFISADYERIKDYTLSIYNAKGQLVKRYDGTKDDFWVRTEIVWDGTDEQGRQVAPGTYLYKLEYNGHAVVRKMVLLR